MVEILDDGHVVMVALDVDNGAIYFGKQGSWFNNGTSDNSIYSSRTNRSRDNN